MRKYLLGAALSVCVLLLLTGVAAAGDFTPGAAGTGDPYFPLAGSGGYDVGNYALTPAYDRASNHLTGRAIVSATATQDLSRFDLDLRGFSVSRVLVNGRAARFARDGQRHLVLEPAAGRPGRPRLPL